MDSRVLSDNVSVENRKSRQINFRKFSRIMKDEKNIIWKILVFFFIIKTVYPKRTEDLSRFGLLGTKKFVKYLLIFSF